MDSLSLDVARRLSHEVHLSTACRMCLHSRSSIRSRNLSCIAIKVPSMHPRATTNSYRCTTLQDQCPEPAHQPTMLLWSPSTAGSKSNSLRISILPHRRTSRNKYPIISASLTKNARRTGLDTLRRSSIENGLRQARYAVQTIAGNV